MSVFWRRNDVCAVFCLFPVTRHSLNRLPFAADLLSGGTHQPPSVEPGHVRRRRGHVGPVARGPHNLEDTCDFL